VDEKGDKFVRVINTPFGQALVTSAPVRDSTGSLVGVMLVGTRIETLLSTTKTQTLADIILLDDSHKLLGTTLPATGDTSTVLENAAVEAAAFTTPKIQELSLYGRTFQVLYSPFILRAQPVGLLGIAMPSSYVVSTEATSRNTFSLLFTLGTCATILVGYLLAQNIARPILRLRTMSQSVASGDLNQTINLRRSDEIGDLAEAFDQMTSHLRDRTEEAERLYAETVQRNKELAAINARLQETQLQLIQSEKLAAIGQLTAGIVHDVKNPLTVIKGTAELMQEEPNLSDDERKELSMIRESAVKANNIVSDLLKFARQTTAEKKSQDLRETVTASIRLTTYLSRQAQVKMDVSLPDQPVMVAYDAQQVEQVFINLIANAIQAMPDRGSLQVNLEQKDGMATVSFADTGTGIPPEIINRIFDPFFTTKPEGQGTGLGLSVSYGIIASHEGRIEVQSQVGQGTTFTVFLPLEQSGTTRKEVIHDI
jgi:two-component system NtrC family sensor kinase